MIPSNPEQPVDLFQVVDQLSVEEKAALAKHLLGSELTIGFNTKPLNRSMVAQVNAMDRKTLSDLLLAIADRMG